MKSVPDLNSAKLLYGVSIHCFFFSLTRVFRGIHGPAAAAATGPPASEISTDSFFKPN